MILGVCNWLGRRFYTDPLIFRVIFLVLLIIYGTGLVLYLALWVVKSLTDNR
ncbi:MAG: PspC domain-containing protein [Ichthyobacteriaceae bacterium]|nr:PspC domain-containing protein [Ichthyobacteriaceae bacterium]